MPNNTKRIEWQGKATLTDTVITEDQYNKYFDKELLSYSIVQSTLKVCHGTNMELTVDYLKPVGRNEIINAIAYGDKWIGSPNLHDLPHFRFHSDIKVDGKPAEFYSLPYSVRKYIATLVVEKDEFYGAFNVIQKGDKK